MKRILGISDEVTTCECCGRTNLKNTVVIGTEEGEAYYGCSCAAKFLGRTSKGATTKIANEALNAQAKRSAVLAKIADLWTQRADPRLWVRWKIHNQKGCAGDYEGTFNRIINEWASEL